MRNKILIEFIGPRVFRIFVPIHICYLFISQFTKFEDLSRGLEGWDTGQRKMRKGGGKRGRKRNILRTGSFTNPKINRGETTGVVEQHVVVSLRLFLFSLLLSFPSACMRT